MRAALVLVAVILVPASASAQLGKLKKKATEAAAGAAGVPTTAPKYVAKVNLTSAQIAQANKGLEAEAAQAPGILKSAEDAQKDYEKAQEKYQKDYDAYSRADDKYRACKEKIEEADRPKREALEAKGSEQHDIQVDETKMQALAEKAKVAAERVQAGTATAEDRKTLQDFQQYMAGVQAQASGAMAATTQASNELQAFAKDQQARIEKTCGAEPQRPRDPKQGPRMAQDQILDAGAAASGVQRSQWQALREEVIALAMSNTRVKSGAGTSEDEANAINQQIELAQQNVQALKKAGVPL